MVVPAGVVVRGSLQVHVLSPARTPKPVDVPIPKNNVAGSSSLFSAQTHGSRTQVGCMIASEPLPPLHPPSASRPKVSLVSTGRDHAATQPVKLPGLRAHLPLQQQPPPSNSRRVEPLPQMPPSLELERLEKPELLEVAKLPPDWQALCNRRETAVSDLLAIATQAPRSKAGRRKLGVVMGEYRSCMCALVEALLEWEEAFETNKRLQEEYHTEVVRRVEYAREYELDRRRGRAAVSAIQEHATQFQSIHAEPSVDAGRASPPLFSKTAMRVACTPFGEGIRPESWDGTDYLLKVLTDIWRLPLPCCSDPFVLTWLKGSDLSAEKTNAKDLSQLQTAEKALKRRLHGELRGRFSALVALEDAVASAISTPDRTDTLRLSHEAVEGWLQLSGMLYSDGASGFLRLKKEQNKSKKMADLSATFSVGPQPSQKKKRGKPKKAESSESAAMLLPEC